MRQKTIGGIIGFVLGILGNLVASVLEKKVIGDQLTSPRFIFVLFACTAAGIFIAAYWDSRQTTPPPTSNNTSSDFAENTTIRSDVELKGKGIRARRNWTFGSTIKVDTRSRSEDE